MAVDSNTVNSDADKKGRGWCANRPGELLNAVDNKTNGLDEEQVGERR